MKKFKPFIKPIFLLTLGITLMILFKDSYVDFFTKKESIKNFTIEYTKEYKSSENDKLIAINENIDSYIILKNNKLIKNLKVGNIVNIEKINVNSTTTLLINTNDYSEIIEFEIENKIYKIFTEKENEILKINVKEEEKQD